MSHRRTAMTPKPLSRFCVNSPMAAFGGQPWGTSATAASGWPRPVRHSASRSRPLRAVETDSPAGICWVVERSFAWLSRYRRLNTIFERSKEHLIAFVAIAFISILSRRLKRLVVEELSA